MTRAAADVDQHAWLVVALAFLVCCSGPAAPRAAATAQPATASGRAVEQKVNSLKAEFPDATVQLDATRSHVERIQNLVAARGAERAEDLARSVLQRPVVAAALGVSPDLRELCHAATRNDPQLDNYAVVRFQQCVNGVKVFGGELIMNVRLKPTPAIDTLTSSLRADVPNTTAPTVSADAAEKTVTARLKGRGESGQTGASSSGARSTLLPPELVVFVPAVFQLKGPSRLCWLVRRDGMAVFVDAMSGSVVHQYSEVQRGSIG